MVKTHYNKLVRDRIPEIIEAEGRACGTDILAPSDYQQALRDKVIEEASEVANAADNDLIKELADLYEVLDAVIKAHEIDPGVLAQVRQSRREARGGFEKRIRLLWTDVVNDRR